MKKYRILRESRFFITNDLVSEKEMEEYYTKLGIDFLLEERSIQEVKEEESLEEKVKKIFVDNGIIHYTADGWLKPVFKDINKVFREHENKRYLEAFDRVVENYNNYTIADDITPTELMRKTLENLKEE